MALVKAFDSVNSSKWSERDKRAARHKSISTFVLFNHLTLGFPTFHCMHINQSLNHSIIQSNY